MSNDPEEPFPEGYPVDGTFAEVLNWHLSEHYTRPPGSTRQGEAWRRSEFADEAANGSVKNVSNWLRRMIPANLKPIELALFGPNPKTFQRYRRDLRRAASQGRHTSEPSGRTKAVSSSVTVPDGISRIPRHIGAFVDRVELFEKIDRALNGPHPANKTVVIRGLGGSGKSTLAAEYAVRHEDEYAGVWWCSAETSIALQSSLLDLADALGLDRDDRSRQQSRVKSALDILATSKQPWLLIYDNVPHLPAIAEYLPAGSTKLLITSRFPYWDQHIPVVPVGEMSLPESVSLLTSIAGDQAIPDAETLARALAFLPLALNQAGHACLRLPMRFSEYERKAETLINLAPSAVAGLSIEGSFNPYPRSVFATFEIAMAEAKKRCAMSDTLMGFLSYCAPDSIPLDLAQNGLESESEFLQSLLSLQELALVEPVKFEDGDKAINVHRLVQSVARSRSQREGTGGVLVEKLIKGIAAIAERIRFTTLTTPDSEWARYVPHALSIHRHKPAIQSSDEQDIMWYASDNLTWAGHYAEAESILKSCLTYEEQLPGRNRFSILENRFVYEEYQDTNREAVSQFLGQISVCQAKQGKTREALASFKRALEVLANIRRLPPDAARCVSIAEQMLAVPEKSSELFDGLKEAFDSYDRAANFDLDLLPFWAWDWVADFARSNLR